MIDLDSPDRQLRAIRSLMERATIYRSLLAPAAFIGGLLSAVAAVAGVLNAVDADHFLYLWLCVMAVTLVSNFFFLWRGAKQRGDAFISPGMRSALLSVAPAFILAGVLTFYAPDPMFLVILWVVFYGIGLLATQHFAPLSIKVLGGAFFVSGLVLLFMAFQIFFGHSTVKVASVVMGTTFGGYHLIYAITIWAFGSERSAQLPSPSENV